MTNRNVLISSAAAKVLLVEAFKKARDAGRVFTCDTSLRCAAGLCADEHFPVLPISHSGALEQLTHLCEVHAIGLIVPTRDGELSFFAKHRQHFERLGTKILVPSPENLERCQNKRLFTEWLQERRLPVVPLVAHDPILPVFVRPIRGAAGVGARRIDSQASLDALEPREDYLVHPFIEAPEYSIDLLMDLDGHRAVQAVCRSRLHVVAGESKVSRVVRHERLAELACSLGECLGLVGHNTVQAFDHPEMGVMFIEVNPRFGGASNLSIQAGLQSPERILAMLGGDESAYAPRMITIGATMYRYSNDIIVEET